MSDVMKLQRTLDRALDDNETLRAEIELLRDPAQCATNISDVYRETRDKIAAVREKRLAELVAENALLRAEVSDERLRCIAICEGWIGTFQDRDIKYTSAREYAIGAIEDIIDIIRAGRPVSTFSSSKQQGDPADIWDAYCEEVPADRRSPQGAMAFALSVTSTERGQS